jgi:3-methyladenine DNA glycosylase/8-oxoguanine DNA glycosylase
MPDSLYGFLMIRVFLQNTQVRRTVQMVDAMLENFGRTVRFPDGTILPALWQPEAILAASESALRKLRIGYRARTVWRLSKQFAAHPEIEGRLLAVENQSELRRELGGLYGVGPATAGYASFEWFKNLDDLVHLSPWESKILGQLLFERPASPGEVITEARSRWAPYTMLALHAVFENVFWKRAEGVEPKWLDDLIRL